MSNLLNNPCVNDTSVFNPLKPTKIQKEWLIQQVVDGHMTGKSIQQEYGIKKRVVNVWVYRYRKHKEICSGVGRPRAFDQKAMQEIQAWLHENENNINDRKELKIKLIQAYSDTKRRLMNNKKDNTGTCNDKIKNISHGTLINYMSMTRTDKLAELLKEN